MFMFKEILPDVPCDGPLSVTSIRDNEEYRAQEWQGCEAWNIWIIRKCPGVVYVGETE